MKKRVKRAGFPGGPFRRFTGAKEHPDRVIKGVFRNRTRSCMVSDYQLPDDSVLRGSSRAIRKFLLLRKDRASR